jgi:hypothetical protein
MTNRVTQPGRSAPAITEPRRRVPALAVCFHHAARGADADFAPHLQRLQELTADGDYAFYTDIARVHGRLASAWPARVRRLRAGWQCAAVTKGPAPRLSP